MPEHDLPVLTDLRDDLDAAFARAEAIEHTPKRRRRWAVSAGGLALAGAVAAVIALTSGADSGRLAPPPANAAEALRRVAQVAATTPAPVPRDDQYYYVRSKATWRSGFAGMDPAHEHAVTLVDHEREIWLSVARDGKLVDEALGSRPLTPADAHRRPGPPLTATPGGPMGKRSHYSIGGEKLSRDALLAYPTDPKTIYDRLLERTGGRGRSPEGEVFTEIGDALRESPAPPALRSGLYGALAYVPGIELVGAVEDSAGRPGTAVAFTEIGIRRELIFDPATSELLAEQEVLVDPAKAELDAPAGTIVGDAVYLQRAVTDDLARPAG